MSRLPSKLQPKLQLNPEENPLARLVAPTCGHLLVHVFCYSSHSPSGVCQAGEPKTQTLLLSQNFNSKVHSRVCTYMTTGLFRYQQQFDAVPVTLEVLQQVFFFI